MCKSKLTLFLSFCFLKFSAKTETQGITPLINQNQTVFIENKGQVMDLNNTPVDDVLFKASLNKVDVYLTTQGLTYVFAKPVEQSGSSINQLDIEWNKVDMIFVGADIRKENVITESDVPAFYNYYSSCSSNGSITNVKAYNKIIVGEIYPGIDWVLYSNGKGNIEYDFILHPGANLGKIRFTYNGAEISTTDNNNVLRLKTKFGEIREGKVVCYQKDMKTNQKISSHYFVSGNEVSFVVKNYDPAKTLVIDPLVWATYYGGGSFEYPTRLKVDNSGNIYVTGYCSGIGMPVQSQGGSAFYQGTNNGNFDVFILKFSNSGVLQWATCYGGSDFDRGYGINTDASGNCFVTGSTRSTDFPLKTWVGAYNDNTLGGVEDVFILKFNNSGVLQWGTLYGGTGDENGQDIVIDGSNNIYLFGSTNSANFPTLNNAGAYFDNTFGGGLGTDAFLLKFNSAGVRQWSTYYGGNGYEYGQALSIDVSGNLYITGNTESNNLFVQNPGGGTYMQNNYGGGSPFGGDAFVAKFNSSNALLWSTYYGGSDADMGMGIVTDPTGNIYVTGQTYSTDFSLMSLSGAYNQSLYGGGIGLDGGDIFMVKFGNDGVRKWSTYYGGNLADRPWDITVDKAGNTYVTGYTSSPDFPIKNRNCEYNQSTYSGPSTSATWGDVFIIEFNNVSDLLWATYYGGSDRDAGGGIEADSLGCIYITGRTVSPDLPLIYIGGGAYYQSTNGGGTDGFVLKSCSSNTSGFTTNTTSKDACNGNNGTVTVTPNGGVAPFTYLWSTNPAQTTQTVSGLKAGNYMVTIADANCLQAIVNVTIAEGISNLSDSIPNVFTPNGDGINDQFKISFGSHSAYTIKIYDRWGQEMYTGISGESWNGTVNGNNLPEGVYYYHISYKNCLDEQINNEGTITLLR